VNALTGLVLVIATKSEIATIPIYIIYILFKVQWLRL
jgi:hypothetical protein